MLRIGVDSRGRFQVQILKDFDGNFLTVVLGLIRTSVGSHFFSFSFVVFLFIFCFKQKQLWQYTRATARVNHSKVLKRSPAKSILKNKLSTVLNVHHFAR